MRMIFRVFQKRKGIALVTLLCSCGSVVTSLLWNRELAVLIDGVQAGQDLEKDRLIWCTVYLVVAALFQGGMQFFSAYAGEYAVHDLRMSLARAVIGRDYKEITGENSSEMISVQQNEMEEINRYISDNFFTLCSTVISFVLTLLFLLTQNAILTVIYLVPVAGLAVYTTVSGKVIYRYTKKEQEQQKKLNGVTGILLTLFPVIHVYEAGTLLRKSCNERIFRWEDAVVVQERTKATLMSVSGMLSCIPLVLLMLAGGAMIMEGRLSIGVLYVFVNLSGNVSGVMINISTHLANFRRFAGNLERVRDAIEEGVREHECFVGWN